MKNKKKAGRALKALASAQSYEQWLAMAAEVDGETGMDRWRREDRSQHYSYTAVRKHLEELKEYRLSGNVYRLLDLLHDTLRRHLTEICHPALYSRALSGTKYLIDEFLEEASAGLIFLCDNEFPHLPADKKLRLFTQAFQNFGRPALMLSGGATFGLFHLGVVRALHQQELLPKVISGSSMGAIVASGTCTRKDAEIEDIRSGKRSLNRSALTWLPPRDMWREKALMDAKTLYRNIRSNVGDYTFAEAFERTGRILNISVSPTRTGMKPRVLNYLTAPNVTIASAALASSAIPGVFPPAKLMAKDRVGQIMPYMASEKWVDGTIRGDLPIQRVARLFNVNLTIVSQTNPHVVPFLAYRKKSGVLPFAVDMTLSLAQAQVLQALNVARQRVDASPLRLFLDQAYAVAGQQYVGDITIIPRFSPLWYRKLLTNPTKQDMEKFEELGERATWPALCHIRNSTVIPRTIERCREKLAFKESRVEARPL